VRINEHTRCLEPCPSLYFVDWLQSLAGPPLEHERRYLASLKVRGVTVLEVPGEGFDLAERMVVAWEVMRAGAKVLYQAAFVVPPWLGRSDFLEQVEEVSSLGA
jgi:hypothetical protein